MRNFNKLMEQTKIKVIKKYVLRFLTYSFCIAGGLYFAFTFAVMTTIPKVELSGIDHMSSQSITKVARSSLFFWQQLFWLPIIFGLVSTSAEFLIKCCENKQKLSEINNP